VVKITTVEKVRILQKSVEPDYVNQKLKNYLPADCGKLLWIKLCILWKSIGYQQVLPFFPSPLPHVEKPE